MLNANSPVNKYKQPELKFSSPVESPFLDDVAAQTFVPEAKLKRYLMYCMLGSNISPDWNTFIYGQHIFFLNQRKESHSTVCWHNWYKAEVQKHQQPAALLISAAGIRFVCTSSKGEWCESLNLCSFMFGFISTFTEGLHMLLRGVLF